MKIYISDKEKLNTTMYKIKQTLKQYDLSKVKEIEFVVKDLQGTFTAEKAEEVYRIILAAVIEICEKEISFKNGKTYMSYTMPRVSINLKNIIKQIEC